MPIEQLSEPIWNEHGQLPHKLNTTYQEAWKHLEGDSLGIFQIAKRLTS